MTFVTFRHKETGVLTELPDHYADHPVFGEYLELYVPEDEEYEEEKVVVETHEVPLDQRINITAKPKAIEKADDKESE